MLDLIHKIVSKTIGYDLVDTKPMTEEENKKFWEENERRRKEWEDSHPEEVAKMKVWEEKYKTKKPYTPTYEERETIKELLNIDSDEWFDTLEIYIFSDGDICVRTPQSTWTSLCGREWTINLKDRKVTLTALN